MSVLDRSDYPSLSCGFPQASCISVPIVGMRVLVYGLEEIKDSSRPITALIAAHGRMGKQQELAGFASGILGYAASSVDADGAKPAQRDLIVVTIDQRNHGERILEKNGNLSFDKNPRHLLDMYAMISGASQDISFVIDFLAAYLFPHGERTIEQYAVTGISLGGHAAWRVLRDDARVKVGVPIIGTPSEGFLSLLGPRAIASAMSLEPPTLPPTLAKLITSSNTHQQSPYAGKKILVLSGQEDTLVPYAAGQDAVEVIRDFGVGKDGTVDIWVQEGVGHACSKEMVKRVAEWLQRWTL